MKMSVEIQHHTGDMNVENIKKIVKDDMKTTLKGIKNANIDTVEVFYIPDRKTVAYVAKTKTDEVFENVLDV